MSFALDGPVVLAGAGRMGAALLAGWIERGLRPRDVIIQDPDLAGEAAALARKHALNVVPELAQLASPPSVIVVAVQTPDDGRRIPAAWQTRRPGDGRHVDCSRKSIANFARHLPQGTAIVRAMPNTLQPSGAELPVQSATPTSRRNRKISVRRCLRPPATSCGSKTRR